MTVQKERMSAAAAIVKSLKNACIQHVFCVPGESYLSVLDALYDEPSIRVISARHEGGAAFMAEGYAKSTLKPGVVLATRGVGAANVSIGVHTAYQDSTPLLVLLGQVHRDFKGREGFQEVDLEQFFQPIAKWVTEVRDPKRMPEIMERALRVAQSGRPGPVVISLPEDVLPVEEEMVFRGHFEKPKPVPAVSEWKEVERFLSEAKKPVVIAGGGIKSARAEEELKKFSERFTLPVYVAFRRHDVFSHRHPFYFGHLGLGERTDAAITEADLIIAIGTRLSEVTTKDYTLLHDHHRLIHIDIDPETIGKVYNPDLGIVADAKEALSTLVEMVDIAPTWEGWVQTKNENDNKITAQEENHQLSRQIITCLQTHLPADALLTNDAGNFASWLHDYFSFTAPHTYVGPTSGAMGYGLPAAIGAKLAFPKKTVVALAGDGGFMMTANELETAVRYHIPIIILVFNNKMYGTIRMHQEIHYPKKVIGTDLGDISFTLLAESVGAKGHTVETAADFQDIFKQALQHDGVTVIEIITDKEQISPKKTITQIRGNEKGIVMKERMK